MQDNIYSQIGGSANSTGSSDLTTAQASPSIFPVDARRRRNLMVGISLAAIGATALILSYLESSIILTFIGLGLSLWSFISFYATTSRLVTEEIFVPISLSSVESLSELISNLGYRGRVVFVHPKSLEGLKKGFLFISKDESSVLPPDSQFTSNKVFFENPPGILISAPEQAVVDLFERKLGVNFATVNVPFLQEKLPRLLTEDLQLVENMTLEEQGSHTRLVIQGGACAQICSAVSQKISLGNHFGCPVCSAFALIISKTTASPIMIEKNASDGNSITTTFVRVDREK